MRKVTVLAMVCVLAVSSLGLAAATQNAAFNVPKSSAISCDGNLSDWTNSTDWSAPYISWYGTMTSTTQAKFAWSDASDMLYVAIKTNEQSYQPGGHPVLGVGISASDRAGGYTEPTRFGATQLAFDINGSNVDIMNEIAYYNENWGTTYPCAGVTTGVQAGYSYADGYWTYEIATPLYANWADATSHALSGGDTIYVYGLMENAVAGGTPPWGPQSGGTDLTVVGNPAFADNPIGNNGSALTLVPEPCTIGLLLMGGLALLRRKN